MKPVGPLTLVVVPTLGRRLSFLDLALASIAGQQGNHQLDLVIVSPDIPPVHALCAKYNGRWVSDPGSGIAGAINAGIEAAQPGTEYITWLGDDDLLCPGSLEASVAALRADPEVSMVFGWCDYINEDGATVFASRAGSVASRILGFGPNLIPQPGSLLRLRHVVSAGGLDPTLNFAMDLDLFLRLRKQGRIAALPRTLACFRWHPDSTTVGAEQASAAESDAVRQRYMSPLGARFYKVLRWPGRFALRLAKWQVRRNVRRIQAARKT